MAYNIVDVMVYLVNLSFTTGTFPAILKKAIVLPLHKKGDREVMSNYRPISLLTSISKVFEKLVHARIYKFLSCNDFLSDEQFGFRPGRGCEDALLRFTGALWNGINNENTSETLSLFIDLTKAFDSVDHAILLDKFEMAGFRGLPLRWLESYMNGRSQRVRISSDAISTPAECLSGVPQGSVLGPLMFLVYINSLLQMDLTGSVTAYADDVALVYTGNGDMVRNSMASDLQHMNEWLNYHKMVISQKSVAMSFGGRNPRDGDFILSHSRNCEGGSGSSCMRDCIRIGFVRSYKYLGVIMDSEMKWSEHSAMLCKDLRSLNGQLYRLRSSCSAQLLRAFYCAIGESRLRYGLLCWGGAAEVNLRPVFIAQKAIIRNMSFANRLDSSGPLFRRWGLLPLRCLFVYRVSSFYFESCGDHLYFVREINPRRAHVLILPRPRYESFRRSFNYLAPLIVNNLRNLISPMNARSVRRFLDGGVAVLHDVLSSRYVS